MESLHFTLLAKSTNTTLEGGTVGEFKSSLVPGPSEGAGGGKEANFMIWRVQCHYESV